jgi:N-acetylmuramoyl-L-alanine amidase
VAVYRTGSFAAVIPFSTGTFAIAARADLGKLSTETVRTIFVAEISSLTAPPPLVPNFKILETTGITMVEVSTSEIILKTGPAVDDNTMAYDLFIPEGVKLCAQGRLGNETRIKLSETEYLWGEEKYLKALSSSTPQSCALLGNIRSKNKDRSFVVSLDLTEQVPFRAVLSEDLKTLSLFLYYTVSNGDRIRLDTSGKIRWGKEIFWAQPARETAQVICRVKEKIWGYDLRYEKDRLICEIFFAPRGGLFKRDLSGITVAVDPGHSPNLGDGAISPQGFPEGEINYRISEELKKKLESRGAKVFMTREREESVALMERGRRAAKAGADLFISIHANAVPDGSDPWGRKGYSVFYFQPSSLGLAKAAHSALSKYVDIEDDGLSYGNLAVCRSPRIPSILVEAGYLIRPDEEELLLNPEFQRRFAAGIVRGVADFVRARRRGRS